MSQINQISLVIDWKVVFSNTKNICFNQLPLLNAFKSLQRRVEPWCICPWCRKHFCAWTWWKYFCLPPPPQKWNLLLMKKSWTRLCNLTLYVLPCYTRSCTHLTLLQPKLHPLYLVTPGVAPTLPCYTRSCTHFNLLHPEFLPPYLVTPGVAPTLVAFPLEWRLAFLQ